MIDVLDDAKAAKNNPKTTKDIEYFPTIISCKFICTIFSSLCIN